MKILHVTNHFYPCVGGIEKHVLDLCEHLIKRGHISDVLCLNKCPDGATHPQLEKKGAITIHRVPFIDLKYYKIGLGVLTHVAGYDVIHVHGLGFFFDFLAATKHIHGKKIVLSTHGGFFHTRTIFPVKKAVFRTITRFLLRRADRIIAVSRQDYALFSMISDNVECIPNGIDCGRYHSSKRKNGFVYVGRLSRNKGLANLVKTFRIVSRKDSRTRLAIVGNGGLLPALKNMAQGFEENIVFLGNVTEREKRNILSKARFIVSASEYEGFGIAVLEGMASGCVPILNDIPAFRSFESGFRVDYSRPEKAADDILALMKKNVTKERMASQNKAKAYELDRVIKRWIDTYG